LLAVDQDIRPQLLNNIVLVGGATLTHGFVRRFDAELKQLFPGPNVRLIATSSPVERKYATWVGGSILASLGSFHQVRNDLWAFPNLADSMISSGYRAKNTTSMVLVLLKSGASNASRRHTGSMKTSALKETIKPASGQVSYCLVGCFPPELAGKTQQRRVVTTMSAADAARFWTPTLSMYDTHRKKRFSS
jgi:hypothetical protein